MLLKMDEAVDRDQRLDETHSEGPAVDEEHSYAHYPGIFLLITNAG